MFDLKVGPYLSPPCQPLPLGPLFLLLQPNHLRLWQHAYSKLQLADNHLLPKLQGKAKRNAWQAKHDELNGDAEKAKTEYVALVEKLKAEHGYDANKVPEAVGSGN